MQSPKSAGRTPFHDTGGDSRHPGGIFRVGRETLPVVCGASTEGLVRGLPKMQAARRSRTQRRGMAILAMQEDTGRMPVPLRVFV